MAHTKYSNLSDKELLAHIETVRHSSPIIDELADRLEDSLSKQLDEASSVLTTCPVCEADLKVDVESTGLSTEHYVLSPHTL